MLHLCVCKHVFVLPERTTGARPKYGSSADTKCCPRNHSRPVCAGCQASKIHCAATRAVRSAFCYYPPTTVRFAAWHSPCICLIRLTCATQGCFNGASGAECRSQTPLRACARTQVHALRPQPHRLPSALRRAPELRHVRHQGQPWLRRCR